DGGTVSSVNGMATADFASGEIAYLLQGNQTENIWGQIIDIEGKDAESYPVLSDNRVYKVCNQGVFDYSNTSDSNNHLYDNDGYCACGEIQPANLNEGVYEIGNVGQLYWFAGLVNGTLIDGTPQNTAANAKLTADIVVNKGETDDAVASCNGTKGDGWKDWTPIGSGSNNYIGTFNGNNHTISGLYFNDDAQNNVGLFGNIHDKNAKVYDLGILDSYFKGNYYVGGVCGYNYYGTIENCQNSGTVNGKSDYVGGVCGYNDRGTITGCHNKGAVSGSGNVGGVCGENRFFTPTDSLITKCYNEGEIVGLGNVGGVCGQNNGGTVSDCYSTGAVSSTSSGSPKVGGVCGHNNSGTVSNCYSIGTVSDDNSTTAVLGAVCGNNSGTVTNCYYDNEKYEGDAVGSGSATSNEDAGMATADFESGKVACALQGEQEEDIWGQSIDDEPIDTYPVLGGKRVYYGYFSCDVNVEPNYTNIESNATERPAHKYDENGFCKVCDVYEPAVKNDGGVYEIGNAGQLYWFAGLVNGDKTVCDYDSSSNPDGTRQNSSANAILTANIVVNEGDIANYNGEDAVSWRTWTPIGNESNYYTGSFDGQNYTISGLYFNDSTKDYVGLFGRITGAGTTPISISNVHIRNSYFKANNDVGGVCGYAYYNIYSYRARKTIENCTNSGTVIGNSSVGGVCGATSNNTTIKNCQNTGTVSGGSVGGVCGYNYQATITNCSNTGAVSGSGNVGGVCAYNGGESITGCYNTGAVSGTGDNVGGVCGYNYVGEIKNCYNEGAVSGSSYVGGVSGCNTKYDTASIINCYNKGTVSGKVDYVGGVSGCAANSVESIGSITNCYNTGEVSCESEDSTNVGGVCGCLAVDNNATGSITNCYYLVADGTVEEKDDFDGTTFKTAAEFASGEVAFLLRATKEDKIWGQDLANNELYPALNNKQVYRVCTGTSLVYSNDLGDESHDFDDDGFCKYCGAYKPAVKNGDGVYEIELAGQL
ncbi:MAG: GLUG motif-containing protein, partial [Acutalibacteraceae bacterium]